MDEALKFDYSIVVSWRRAVEKPYAGSLFCAGIVYESGARPKQCRD
jgi:hypothetical protein